MRASLRPSPTVRRVAAAVVAVALGSLALSAVVRDANGRPDTGFTLGAKV